MKDNDNAPFGVERLRDQVIFVAPLLLNLLFLVNGWGKLTDYAGTAAYRALLCAPIPFITAVVVIVVEAFVALVTAAGLFTRPLVLLLGADMLGTGLFGHPFWMTDGAARNMDAITFYKNISIMGICLLLYITEPGRHSLDALLSWRMTQTATN